MPNKYDAQWYPVGESQFRNALTPRDNNDTLAVAQAYFDLKVVNSQWYREYFARSIFNRGYKWIDGIQFDMLPWHNNDDMLDFLARLKHQHDTTVILQCHKQAMERLGTKGVVDRLGRFACAVDYVLFDASLGQGKTLDFAKLEPFLTAAYESESLKNVGFAIAGGLDGPTVRSELPGVISRFPDISWDSEAKLHMLANDDTRPLDMLEVTDYLIASNETVSLID